MNMMGLRISIEKIPIRLKLSELGRKYRILLLLVLFMYTVVIRALA